MSPSGSQHLANDFNSDKFTGNRARISVFSSLPFHSLTPTSNADFSPSFPVNLSRPEIIVLVPLHFCPSAITGAVLWFILNLDNLSGNSSRFPLWIFTLPLTRLRRWTRFWPQISCNHIWFENKRASQLPRYIKLARKIFFKSHSQRY